MEGEILDLRARVAAHGEVQREKRPLEASLGHIKRKGPTYKRRAIREIKETQSEEVHRIDLINVEIQANLTQSGSTKATKQLDESTKVVELNTQQLESSKE